MAVWVMMNLGLRRDLQIDRINNSGHYEPENLRYATPQLNQSNTRKRRINVLFHRFRREHPEIRYADSTLHSKLGRGMTEQEIIAQFYEYSSKPKGVYGTFSTADPAIASLSRDS
jgi:hypothetical protein